MSSTGDPMHHKRSKIKPDEEPPSPGGVSVQVCTCAHIYRAKITQQQQKPLEKKKKSLKETVPTHAHAARALGPIM